MKTSFALLAALLCAAVPAPGSGDAHLGTFAKWSKVEIRFEGPASKSRGTPNPFSVAVDVTFTAPGGKTYKVPGFYDGDGAGGPDGSVWKVRFSADEVGAWRYASRSAEPLLDGRAGSFTVEPPAATAPLFYRWGRLERVGTAADKVRYLKFRDGPHWLKAGCDDPENFLGKLKNFDTPAKRRAAIDYLAGKGINSFYVLTHNVAGDDSDVWPWIGSDVKEAKANGGKDARFDVAKLGQWRSLFEHMQERGVVPYLVLEDDSAWNGLDRARYYREIVARFGDLPALLFNFAEEHNETHTLAAALEWMRVLAEIDPYRHPRGIHNVNAPADAYADSEHVDFTAIQTGGPDPLQHNRIARDWIGRCRARGTRVLVTGFDEPRPELDRRGWWSAYLGGGVWEAHVTKPYDRPLVAWDEAWTQLGGARAFMETLPFWEMEPANFLVSAGNAFCLAKPGEAYALYLPKGGAVEVNLTPGPRYRYQWWDPRGGRQTRPRNGGTTGGGAVRLSAPSSDDWALRIVKTGGQGNSAPLAFDTTVAATSAGSPIRVVLAFSDRDGPGPHVFKIVGEPAAGTLARSGDVVTYTPRAGAPESDAFRWIVSDGLADSNPAIVRLAQVDGNLRPIALDRSFRVAHASRGRGVSIPLLYDDPDGPGPHRFTIVTPPAHGKVAPDSAGGNDYLYIPEPGFKGTDGFRWTVSDGRNTSEAATVTIEVVGPSR